MNSRLHITHMDTPHSGAADRCSKCDEREPDMDSVPLQALLEAVSLFLDDGQSITIHPRHTITVNALGKSFVGQPQDANNLLDASATLLRAEAA